MEGDEVNQVVDGIVGEFQTYEDYLDSQISATDLYYLEDEDLARQCARAPADPRAFRAPSVRGSAGRMAGLLSWATVGVEKR